MMIPFPIKLQPYGSIHRVREKTAPLNKML